MASKGNLPKAYLRLDPNLDQTHPDPGAMARLLCAANRQPHRGRFKSRELLDTVLGKATARGCVERRDVVEQADGRFYVPGWDEWQEGDWTVAERQQRIRDRRDATVTESRSQRDPTVTAPPELPLRLPLPTPKAARQQGSKAEDVLTDALTARDDSEPEYPVLAWLSQQGVTIPPNGNGFHRRVVLLVERFGAEGVRSAMAGAMSAGAKGDRAIVFGAENLLDAPPSGKPAAKGKGLNPTEDEAWDAFGGRPGVA